MIDRLRALFSEQVEEEEQLQPELAAAALMFEVIWADHQIEESELNVMKQHLSSAFGLEESRIDHIVAETKRLHDDSVGIHEFTSALNEHLTQSEKIDIVHALWRIAVADSSVDALEEHMIRRIADLLYVSHKEFIAAKIAAREN